MYLAAIIPVVFLAVWGLVDLIRRLEQYLLSGKERQYHIVVIPLQGHVENLEYIVRCAQSQDSWHNKANGSEIVLLDNGLDNESKAMCQTLCREGSVALCDPQTAKDVISDCILFAKMG